MNITYYVIGYESKNAGGGFSWFSSIEDADRAWIEEQKSVDEWGKSNGYYAYKFSIALPSDMDEDGIENHIECNAENIMRQGVLIYSFEKLSRH